MARIESEGKYLGKAVRWELTETSTHQDPMLKATFAVKVKPIDPEPTAWIDTNIVFHGQNQGVFDRAQKSVTLMGWQGKPEEFLEKIGKADSGLDRNEVELDIVMKTFNGELRPEVNWINRAPVIRNVTTKSEDEKKKIASSMADRLRAAAERNKASEQERRAKSSVGSKKVEEPANEFESTVPAPTPSSTDDIPF